MRPIYHSSDAAIRGHVFCSFLAQTARDLTGRMHEGCTMTRSRPAWPGTRRSRPRTGPRLSSYAPEPHDHLPLDIVNEPEPQPAHERPNIPGPGRQPYYFARSMARPLLGAV